MSNEFRKKLKEIRKLRGLGTIEQFSQLIGASRRTVGDYERGHRLPELDYLARFSEISGADLFELIRLRLAVGGYEAETVVREDTAAGYKVPPTLERRRAPRKGRGTVPRKNC